MKYIKYFKNFTFIIAALFNIFLCNISVNAQSVGGEMDAQAVKLGESAGYSMPTSVGGIVAYAVKGFLGLLGIIFLILIIYAGYNWMLARGDEEKVNKAKDTIQRAVIGLIIIISAYAITYFVFKNLGGVGSTGGSGPQTHPIVP